MDFYGRLIERVLSSAVDMSVLENWARSSCFHEGGVSMSWTTIGGNDPARYSSMVAGRATFCSPEGIRTEFLGNGIPLNWEEKDAAVCNGAAKKEGVESPVTSTGSLSSVARSFN